MGRVLDFLLPFLAALAALAIGAVMLIMLGADALEAYGALIEGAFGSSNALAETVVKATPLLLVAVGISIAFRGGVLNIGGEGQYIIGALLTTFFVLNFPEGPALLVIPIAIVLGFIGGAAWGALAGALKAYLSVNEILSTIMLNLIAVQIMNYLLRGPLIDPVQSAAASQIPQTARFAATFDLPRWAPTRLHLGALLAVILGILVWVLLWRTTVGYRIRAVGLNPFASLYAGIRVQRYLLLALLLSGGLAGLAGGIQVLGVSHRMVSDGSAMGFTGGVGFNGIVAALFGQLHPVGSIPASFLFGALLVGANKLQRAVQVPASFITALNGMVVVFVVSSEYWRRKWARQRLERPSGEQQQPAEAVE